MTEEIILNDDMTNVPAADEAVPEGQYSFRVSDVQKKERDNGGVNILVIAKIQTEGPAFGRTVTLNCDMGDPRGLSNLKTLYKAVGYLPGPEGHSPSHLLDGEFQATVKHNSKDGVTYANIIPWSVKAIQG